MQRKDISIVWIHALLIPSCTFEQFKVILEEHINPTLQDNVLVPSDFAEHIYHVGSSHDLDSIIQSGLIPGGKDVKKGRHAVFFTAVNPMLTDQHRERDYDVTKPRIAVYKHTWKYTKITVYWCNLSEGCPEYRLAVLSKAIIFFTTLHLRCVSISCITAKSCT